MINIKLKGCPLCGSAGRIKDCGQGFYAIKCVNADCILYSNHYVSRDKEELLNKWNTRKEGATKCD